MRFWLVCLLLVVLMVPAADCLMACLHPCCHQCGHTQPLLTTGADRLPAAAVQQAEAVLPAAPGPPVLRRPAILCVLPANGPPPAGNVAAFPILRI